MPPTVPAQHRKLQFAGRQERGKEREEGREGGLVSLRKYLPPLAGPGPT